MDRIIAAALPGFPCGWFAPSYKYAAPVFDELKKRLAPVMQSKDEQRKLITTTGGGSIEVWTLDGNEDAGRSRKYKRIVVDEAAMLGKLESIWTQALRATLSDYKGDAWFLSTPKGVAGYFHSLYRRGEDPERKDWSSWRMPTSTNPFIAQSEIDAARLDMTDLAFSQEYLAEFVSWEGSVFRRIAEAVSEVVSNLPAVSIGVDWARTSDYTVFVALDPDGRLIGMERFRGIEYTVQRGRLEAFWRRHGGRSVIVAEANSMGGPVIEQLHRDGLPVQAFTTTASSKAAIIESLALAFERGRIRIPNDPVLIGELQAFEGTKAPSGMIRYSAPEGMHDDTVMALAFAWEGLALCQDIHVQNRHVESLNASPQSWSISPI